VNTSVLKQEWARPNRSMTVSLNPFIKDIETVNSVELPDVIFALPGVVMTAKSGPFSSTRTVLSAKFVSTKSCALSWLKSPTATEA